MYASMLCYSYVRCSTVGQIEGDTERRQLQDARAWAERNGHTFVDKPLRDLGVSAYRGKNQREGAALGQFLIGLKEGSLEPGILYIETIDRLSREPPLRILNLVNDIFDTGTQIHVATMGQTVTKETFQTLLFPMISLMAQSAHYESKLKSERITAANRARQERARSGMKAKGAYNPPWFARSYEKTGEVVYTPISEVFAAIRRIFELAASGMGAVSIAKTLNAEGAALIPATYVRQEESRRWYQSYVGRLLTDRRVIGEYQPVRNEGNRQVKIGEPVSNFFEPVITMEQWDAAQAAQASNNPKLGGRPGARQMRMTNLFTGIARCAHCEGAMMIRATYRKGVDAKSPYLRCARVQQGAVSEDGRKCENTGLGRLDWFESKFLAALPGVPWRDLVLKIPAEDATQGITLEIDVTAREIERLSKASGRLMRIMEAEDEPDADILVRYRELKADIAVLRKRRDELVRDRSALRRNAQIDEAAVDHAVELTQAMAGKTGAELFVLRQKLHTVLKTVIERVYVNTVHDSGVSTARVYIRGGMQLIIPMDKRSPIEAGIYMGGHPAFVRQLKEGKIPPLEPSKEGTRLVRAS